MLAQPTPPEGFARAENAPLATPLDLTRLNTFALDAPLEVGTTYEISIFAKGQQFYNRPYRYRIAVVPYHIGVSYLDYENPVPLARVAYYRENEIALDADGRFVGNADGGFMKFTLVADRPYTDLTVAAHDSGLRRQNVSPTEAIRVSSLHVRAVAAPEADTAVRATPPLPKPTERPRSVPIDSTRALGKKAGSITFAGPDPELLVYDHKRIDGDTVTVLLNGAVLLDRHGLVAEPYGIPLPLKPGRNTLVLYADNLGRVPPNTAAFVVRAGGREERIVLRSDLDESSWLEVEWSPK